MQRMGSSAWFYNIFFFVFFVVKKGFFMEYHQNKRILITGGAGFLGSHLCDRLVAQDFEVLCVDNC